VNVLYGAYGTGLTATGDQVWDQGSSLRIAETPIETALLHAYPNPFTTSATIGYDVAEPGLVRLTVYDLFGREVAVLADGVVEAGRYTAVFDAASLPTGVYLVRMTTGSGFAQTCRVTRVK
jgi:hypothetical protein